MHMMRRRAHPTWIKFSKPLWAVPGCRFVWGSRANGSQLGCDCSFMLVIRESAIQGLGLFTDTQIHARAKLGEFTGERISVGEARRRARRRTQIAIVELNFAEAVDGSVNGGPFRFINHSCNPNVFLRLAHGRIEFYAKRHIEAGEELTCDYINSHHEGKLLCLCGSANCRQSL
jgi:uncharacterized protein